MARDIKIYPSQSLIAFSGSDDISRASITFDDFGRLTLSGSEVIFGPGSNNIYVGDGTGSANIIFEKGGAIRGENGQILQLGSTADTIRITGSLITITGSNVLLGPFSSSFAKIDSGSFTGILSSSQAQISTLTSSNALITNIRSTNGTISNLTGGTATFPLTGAIYFTGSTGAGASIYTDNLGNLVLDSNSGSVFLSKGNQDIYIGDGTSSANIIFDVAGAIKGEDGANTLITFGSPATRLLITGSNIVLGAFTASSATISNANITASVISASSLVGLPSLQVISTISASTLTGNTGSFLFLTSSNLNLPTNGGIFITGSVGTLGASIKLDTQGNLKLTSISGSVLFGNESNDVYMGDGTSSANLVFEAGGAIKTFGGTTLTVGSSSILEITGSEVYLQRNGGPLYLNGNVIVSQSISSSLFTGSFSGVGTGSFTGSFVGDGSGINNIQITSSLLSGSFTGSFSGSYLGDGSALTNISASHITTTSSIRAGRAGDSNANIPALIVTSQGPATTQAAIAIQQEYSEGDTIIFADYSTNTQWNFFHENATNSFRIHGGDITNNYLTSSATFYAPNGTAQTGYVKHIFDQNNGNLSIAGNLNVGSTGSGAKLDVSGSVRVYPTYSSTPVFSGTDGQFVFGTSGSIHFMYVWMAGRWRSSSLD